MKRCFDIAMSGASLLLLTPLLTTLAIVVALTSRGGPFFRQVRVGRHRRSFRILKFRTMTVRPEAADGTFDAGDRSRVTSVGRFLRKTKLDELPQLWNVLVGDMSLVGPRPEIPAWTEVHRARWDRVLKVRPGMTDPASIRYRDEEGLLAASTDPESTYRDEILPRKLDLAERYVLEQSFLGDLAVLIATAKAVLTPRTRSPGHNGRQSDR
ncbi:MAG: sugar transferase [Phycisphaerales bacterium]|nr:sugar transferase [Phycisphaerales bacterium]